MTLSTKHRGIGERLRVLINTLGLSIKDFAKITHIPYRTLQSYILGERKANQYYLELVAQTFNVNLNWLLTGEGEMFIKGKKPRYVEEREEAEAIAQELGLKYVEPVPVLGYVPAGFPVEIPENCIIEWVYLPEVPKGCFVFKAQGDSMSPLIREGDYIVVKPIQDPSPELYSKKIVMYQDEWGEVAIKRLKKKDGKLYLVPENPEYPTLEFDPVKHRLIGKIIAIWRRFKIEE